ncbi:LysR family transcriptional regulator [Sandaracinus amylolyticus]|uniref:Transcriptional regulator, LysR family protein n=1 Tax=Sandaracinus amylolyticus TaxID=927083 RepID=A0A0F6W273_9BACT|nr:LysR family transcriptional regulator [Sandaracinus amylolyticus]AKF05593.1 Transcriptional regulator, LysR family protein [Sandaracinus amylolyticus]
MSPDALTPAALRYFVCIAELGSLTAASRALRISQPSLTVALRKLEEELGTTLFVRTSRGVRTTSSGDALLRHARQVMRSLADARTEIEGLEKEPRGRFTVGCHESLGAYFLPGLMAPFLARHPGIELALWNGNSRDVQRAVLDRVVDVGIVVNPEPHPEHVVQTLFEDRVELVVTSALRRTARREPLALLRSHPLLYVPALKQVQWLLVALEKRDVRASRPLPCSSMELVKSLILDGTGVGVLPRRVASHRVAEGRLVALDDALPAYEDSIAVVRRADAHVTSAMRLLLDALVAHGRSMRAAASVSR